MMHMIAVITIALSVGTGALQSASNNVCVNWYETQTSVVVAEDGSVIASPFTYYCGR